MNAAQLHSALANAARSMEAAAAHLREAHDIAQGLDRQAQRSGPNYRTLQQRAAALLSALQPRIAELSWLEIDTNPDHRTHAGAAAPATPPGATRP